MMNARFRIHLFALASLLVAATLYGDTVSISSPYSGQKFTVGDPIPTAGGTTGTLIAAGFVKANIVGEPGQLASFDHKNPGSWNTTLYAPSPSGTRNLSGYSRWL